MFLEVNKVCVGQVLINCFSVEVVCCYVISGNFLVNLDDEIDVLVKQVQSVQNVLLVYDILAVIIKFVNFVYVWVIVYGEVKMDQVSWFVFIVIWFCDIGDGNSDISIGFEQGIFCYMQCDFV